MPSATSSNYLHSKFLELLFYNTSFTPPSTVYVALFTTVPALAGTGGVEVSTSGTAYARQSIVCSTVGFQGPSGANLEYSNKLDITYSVPTANWGTITGAGLYDASTSGNLLYVATLTTPKVVNNGDGAPRILAGQLRISRSVC